MNSYKLSLVAVCLLASSLLAGCSGGGSNPSTPAPSVSVACPGVNLVEIRDNIDANTTWRTNTIYVIRKWDFYVNATLVIEPGVIVKFHPTDGPGLTLGGTGTIIAEGSAASPIIFTSFKDDAHGCDNNGDGATTTASRRDWGEISTNGLNGSVFDHCEFYYGGGSAYSSTLSIVTGSHATVTNNIFAHNDGGDASGWYGALDTSSASEGTIVENNVFFDNIRPLSVSVAFDIDDSNTFSDPTDQTVKNVYNGIFVESLNHITSHITWEETEVPFVIDDNDFWINSGSSLTLGDNVVLKFRPGSAMVLADGESAIQNHSGPGVLFTSYKDDTLGDTNADGTATSPLDGDWLGISDDTAPVTTYFAWSSIFYDTY